MKLEKEIVRIFKERGIIRVDGNFAPEFKHGGVKYPAPHPKQAIKDILKLIRHTGKEDKNGNII